MKIAVNTRLLIHNKLEGIGWFTYETLRRMVASHPETEFWFIFDRKPDPSFIFGNNVKTLVLRPPARHPLLFVIWFEWSLHKALKRIKPDLFLSPDGYLSLRSDVAALAVMHDLNFEHFPADLPLLVRWYYRFFFPRFARHAERIATVSAFSKQDIHTQYQIPLSDIDVLYNGANELYEPVDEEVRQEVRDKYTSGCPYFMFVGSLHPRKNLARLFTSFDLFKQETDNNIKLLVVGEKKWWTKNIRDSYEMMRCKDEVIFCGRLEAAQLHLVTASALASVYVSYFEGFGIPIVEAFRCGVPVITSNVTSMPEVAGNAALLVDPYSERSIAEAMIELAGDENLRKELVEKGLVRARVFTWDKAAARLWESVLKTIDSSS